MANLGLAAIAGNAALQGYERNKASEQADQRFAWEKQKQEAGLSLLPQETQARRTGLALQNAQNEAGLSLVGQRTRNEQSKLDMEGESLDAQKARQPDELAAQANQATVSRLLSESTLEELPAKIARAKAQGVMNDADTFTASVAKLGDLIETNNTGAVVSFMNGMNDAGVFGKKHAPVASVAVVDDPSRGKVFVAKDAKGKPVAQIDAKTFTSVRTRLAGGNKTELKSVNPGESLVAVQGGKVTNLYTAPESAKSTRSSMGPLERDVDYLVSAHGMTKDEALQQLNSAKSMSREQFILKGISDKQAMGKKASEQDIAELGALYDRAATRPEKQVPSAPSPTSNTKPAGTMNPQIRSLLGIP